ncbi:ictacalcin-like [Epinephelus moara]|uniref:ictacalcin-like n=1 Tax=Epinephelus moara TaxID=300413 RepID=UPI00214E94E2|nr:ictacalcin-like [Epinephelus moara]
MSNTQKAIILLVDSFSKYASKDGDNKSLTKAEMKELLQSELGELLGKATDQAAVDSIFNKLDLNQDNSVDFPEFLNLVGCLSVLCHEHFTKS